ncbi:hypothetical protein [Paenibacillus polymyxa]|uniref:hypothetical protein n=1 Tax=Paenibacillus polymyxa TaxID=1406 RepID=UPI000D835E73|nr:hypothetical protein [Paenibacillus polymyxa]MDU8675342.1 hypothetical protein [Paenibacillus polymyxa]MDU8700249.1 hypothetical protein [Paenibacillus polymyxa]URJ54866.1 hypothetical protein MF623_004265 [Paenibacillus polymyxa]URJ66709.1 hypothetical protein MF620_001611 [Paenibacillus polymyxa]URJ69379.1 hypothetical protein MF624_004246 [Paenibacillus polymyxa]
MSSPQIDTKKWYNKWWVLLIIFFIVAGLSAAVKKDEPTATQQSQSEPQQDAKEESKEVVKQEPKKTPKEEAKEAPVKAEAIPQNEKVKETVSTKSVDQATFKQYASNITGRTFIKNISVKDNKGSIDFYGTYSNYKKENPSSLIKKEEYEDYFSTKEIQKILVGESARLLRQFPDLNAISIVLPFDGKTYSIDLDRSSLNNFLGYKIESLSTEDRSWNDKFSDPYIYDKSNRQKFFDTFVKIN